MKLNRALGLNALISDRALRSVVLAASAALFVPGAAHGITTIYVNRPAFENALTNIVVDDYEQPAYRNGDVANSPGNHYIHSDTAMSGIFGEARYTTTGFTNWNIIIVAPGGNNHFYCAGCNGSYLLDFTATSVGTASGVFGVGLDVVGDADVYNTHAFVTYGDNSTQDIPVPNNGFWGITSDLYVKSIHFGLADGGTNTVDSVQRMAMDNLTFGTAVPEPITCAQIAVGAAIAALRRRRHAS